MPRFTYRAYAESGAMVTGEILTENRDSALAILHRRGEHAIEVREGGRRPDLPWWQRDLLGDRPLPYLGLALFTRELATLVKADIAIDEALRIVAMQPLIGARTRTMAESVLAAVVEGRSLSEALAAGNGAFPDYYCRIVETGEASGQLGAVLDDLAAFLDKSGDARSKLGSALLYPAILLLAAALTLGVIMGLLIPAMLPLFEEAKAEPPAIIAFLAAAGGWMTHWWPVMAGTVVASTVGLFALGTRPAFRLWRDRVALRLPLIGSLISRRDTARFARTLATLTRNGVPLLAAVETAAGALGNSALSSAVLEARDVLKSGGTLTAPLRQSGLFSELALRLISAGEQTGQLETMLGRVADIFDQSLEQQMQRVTTLLTPILTLVIGLVVGGLVISVMGALAGINELALR